MLGDDREFTSETIDASQSIATAAQ
jgi:hypothetical protein